MIADIPTLYAHALAIEREAAARYAEFADRLADVADAKTALLFRKLAGFEAEHAARLEEQARGMHLPKIPHWRYAWLDAGAPETAPHDLVMRLMTPRDALRIALEAEQRARKFFEKVRAGTQDLALRELAHEMAEEEAEHVAWVERALAATPDANVDWEKIYAAGGPRGGT